jgi:hypothetical protein
MVGERLKSIRRTICGTSAGRCRRTDEVEITKEFLGRTYVQNGRLFMWWDKRLVRLLAYCTEQASMDDGKLPLVLSDEDYRGLLEIGDYGDVMQHLAEDVRDILTRNEEYRRFMSELAKLDGATFMKAHKRGKQ